MHFSGIVVGNDVDKELEPFADYTEVSPYKIFLEPDEIIQMAEHYDIKLDDLQSLCNEMKDWMGEAGFVENGQLGFWSKQNPNAKFEWYKIGGRCKDFLRLKKPRKSFWSFLGAKPTLTVDQAMIEEVDLDDLRVKNPLYFILMNGQWYKEGQSLVDSLDGKIDLEWQKQYRILIDSIPPNTKITIVDIHS
jgi:hypothetical protein